MPEPRLDETPTGPRHPKHGRRVRDGWATVIVMTFGTVVGLAACAFAVLPLTGEGGLGWHSGGSPLGTWGSIAAASILGFMAFEFITGNISFYAGQIVRGAAEKLFGRVGQDG